jgi:hypothetical protein
MRHDEAVALLKAAGFRPQSRLHGAAYALREMTDETGDDLKDDDGWYRLGRLPNVGNITLNGLLSCGLIKQRPPILRNKVVGSYRLAVLLSESERYWEGYAAILQIG